MENFLIQTYSRTWCDYLTPCLIQPEIMVGEYECQEKCPFFISIEEYEGKKFDACDYSRYSYVWNGSVKCKIKQMQDENKIDS